MGKGTWSQAYTQKKKKKEEEEWEQLFGEKQHKMIFFLGTLFEL